MYKALDVANYVIDYCNEKQQHISNLKLQKILYFIQAEFLVAKGEPCFSDIIEAWDFGPVIPEVYHRYKVYGAALIPEPRSHKYSFLDADLDLIDGIVNSCSKYSSSQLARISMNQTPWKSAYRRYDRLAPRISNESIRNFFKED